MILKRYLETMIPPLTLPVLDSIADLVDRDRDQQGPKAVFRVEFNLVTTTSDENASKHRERHVGAMSGTRSARASPATEITRTANSNGVKWYDTTRWLLERVDSFPKSQRSFAAPDEDASQPGLTFTAAPLQCDPYAHTWALEGIVSVYGAEIEPSRQYLVQRANVGCPNLLSDESCWSEVLWISTAKYGDITPLYHGDDPTAPQPDFNDIAAMVEKFQATPGAPIKAVAQLQPNCVFPDRPIDFNDIAADVAAFVGTTMYAESNYGPCTCPSSVPCGTTPCANDLAWVGYGDGLCVGGHCDVAMGWCEDGPNVGVACTTDLQCRACGDAGGRCSP